MLIQKIITKTKQTIFRHKFNYRYNNWFKFQNDQYQPSKHKYRPLISIIVPTYNTPASYLTKCLDSVINQTYQNWQICLADDHSTNQKTIETIKNYQKKDPRINVVFRKKNGHISKASNSALKTAKGEFIALLDHDDEIHPNALCHIVNFLNKNPKADFIYTDEDKLDQHGRHCDPSFKPDYSPEFLFSTNYICHFSVIRKKIIDKIGGFRSGFEGSQDYDLFLRLSKVTKNIYHLPKILYHWRKVPGSTSATYSNKSYANTASIKALENHFENKLKVENGLQPGTFKINHQIKNNPKVSIIIPTKDQIKYLKKCLNSILKKSSYQNYEIIIINNDSHDQSSKKYFNQLKNDSKIKIYDYKDDFNFSLINNFAVKKATGQHLIFLNNDTEIISPDWIESLLQYSQQKNIGAVGCKLLFSNHTIQHAGVILGLGGIANHAAYLLSDLISQPFPLLNHKDVVRNYLAITGACLMIAKTKFNKIGGFDSRLAIAYNDIDLCLKLIKANYQNVYTPYAKLFHYQSVSVSKNRNLIQFKKEQQIIKKRYDNYLKNDPFFTPHLNQEKTYLYSSSLAK